MTLTPDQIVTSLEFQGTRYSFCSDRCRRKFAEHPGWYVLVRETVVNKAERE
jgi:YHS domain-containing protein